MRQCPTCGTQIPTYVQICPNCGTVLGNAPPTAPVPGGQVPPQGSTQVAWGGAMNVFNTGPNQGTPGAGPPNMVGNFYNGGAPPYNPQPGQQYPLPPAGQGYYGAPTAANLPPTFSPPPQSRLSTRRTVLLVALAVVVMLAGAGLILYTGVIHPAQLHAQATATVQGMQTAEAHSTATAQAQTTATAQAIAAATATAQSQATAQAQATATALQNLYTKSTSGAPVVSDGLAVQTASNWDVYDAVGGGGCGFNGGALHASVAQQHFYVPCFAHATNFSNFALEAQMTIAKGDEGGLIFRGNDTTSQFYIFRVGRDGNYSLYVSKDDKHSTPIVDDNSSAIKTAAGEMNILTVIAQGNTIYMYINKQYVGSANDGTYSSGEIGIFAGDSTNATDVAFSSVRVWKL